MPGILESLYASHVYTLPDARRAFNPQGSFGWSVYLMETEAQENQLKKAIVPYYLTLLVISGGISIHAATVLQGSSPVGYVVTMAVYGFILWFYTKLFFYPMTRHLKKVPIPSGPVARCKELGLTLNPILLYGVFAVCLGMGLFSAAVFFVYPGHIPAGTGVFFFSMCVPSFIAIEHRLTTHRYK